MTNQSKVSELVQRILIDFVRQVTNSKEYSGSPISVLVTEATIYKRDKLVTFLVGVLRNLSAKDIEILDHLLSLSYSLASDHMRKNIFTMLSSYLVTLVTLDNFDTRKVVVIELIPGEKYWKENDIRAKLNLPEWVKLDVFYVDHNAHAWDRDPRVFNPRHRHDLLYLQNLKPDYTILVTNERQDWIWEKSAQNTLLTPGIESVG